MRNILFLCTGNLNRSYAAHAIALEKLDDKQFIVESAGTGKTAGGKVANKKMREALMRHHFALPLRKSRKLTQDDIEWADVIVCMAEIHRKNVLAQFGWDGVMKCVMFLPDGDDVPDPHFSKDDAEFDMVVQTIEDNMREF
jgi:protein-tyrosine phosphatase